MECCWRWPEGIEVCSIAYGNGKYMTSADGVNWAVGYFIKI